MSKSARLSPFLSVQMRKFTLQSPFLSGFFLLSAFLSAQKSAQAQSEPLWPRALPAFSDPKSSIAELEDKVIASVQETHS